MDFGSRMEFRKNGKHAALAAMRTAGIMKLTAKSPWRGNRLAILCYHALSSLDEHEWDPAFFMPARLFEQRIQWLLEHGYTILGLEEGLERLQRRELPPRSVAITFDDGTADFLRLAWPVLEKYGVPATVYWTTYYAEQKQPVFGMFCGYLLWRGRRKNLPANLWRAEGERSLASETERQAALAEIQSWRRREHLSPADLEPWLAKLAGHLELDYGAILERRVLQLMTPGEASALARRGADIQLHTHRHRTPLNRESFVREIQDNRERIVACTGKAARHFCYPSGKLADEFLGWLPEAGVSSAVTCEGGLVSRNCHPMLLPRIVDTAKLSQIEFEAWVSGARLLLGASAPAGEIVGQDRTIRAAASA